MAAIRITLPRYIARFLVSTYGDCPIKFPETSRLSQIVINFAQPSADVRGMVSPVSRYSRERKHVIEDIEALPFVAGSDSDFGASSDREITVAMPDHLMRYNHEMKVTDRWGLSKSSLEAFRKDASNLFWSELISLIREYEREKKLLRVPFTEKEGVYAFMTKHGIDPENFDAIERGLRRIKKKIRESQPEPACVRKRKQH